MKCKICSANVQFIFNAVVLNRNKVDFYVCPNCGYIQTETPYWIDEAYNSAIVSTDTGIMIRNNRLKEITSVVIQRFFNLNKKFLDYGGGYGILTRQMRDMGFDFFWYDKYAKNLVARGFEYDNQKIELITAFEVFEHLSNPLDEISEILKLSKNILFSTETYGDVLPNPEEWWYYSFDSGQHISFYNVKTLQHIAKKLNVNYYTNNSDIHLFTEKEIDNEKFKEIINNYKYVLSNTENNILSRTFSDMNDIKLRNGAINKINNLEYGYYNFIDVIKDQKVIIFGASNLGKKIARKFKENNIKIEYFSDNNTKLWGTIIENAEVLKPDELIHFKDYLIVIGSTYYMEVYRQLIQMKLNKDRIFYLNGIS